MGGLEDAPAEFATKRQEILDRLDKYSEESEKITDLLSREDVVTGLRSDKVANLEFLKKDHDVTLDMINVLYDFGNFQYSCGNYQAAAELLYQFRILSTDNDKVAAATWGKLASEILTTNWEVAMEEVQKVKESIDTKLFSNPLAQLTHRTWLIHWALFPFFNYEAGRDTICELFFSAPFINTIQTACPWILRYLTAAVIPTETAQETPDNTRSSSRTSSVLSSKRTTSTRTPLPTSSRPFTSISISKKPKRSSPKPRRCSVPTSSLFLPQIALSRPPDI